jgi:hypothetical protein
VVGIIKAREPAGYMTAIGAGKKWHLETKYHWVDQYNFYLRDAEWGPLFVRVYPYFPFSTRICLNQHHWLAQKMKQAGIRFTQSGHAFRRCSDPEALQNMADSLTAQELIRFGHKWLKRLIPTSVAPNGGSTVAGIRCSFPRSNSARTWSSAVAPRWINWANDSSMPIATWADPTS